MMLRLTTWKVKAIALAAGVTALCCASHGETGQFGSGYARVAAPPEVQAIEHQMAKRLNRDRAAAGLAPLEYDEQLADIARAHSTDMRDHQFFAHESPNTGKLDDRLARAGYLALEARENLAEAPDMNTAQDKLMLSPGHHANIMAKTVTHLGIGIVKGGVKDPRNLSFTQVFSSPGEIESLDEARSGIEKILAANRRKAGLSKLAPNAELEQLAEAHIDDLPQPPTPSGLANVGKLVTDKLGTSPIEGVAGVSVGGQLLWSSSQFTPSSAISRPNARQYGLAIRRVQDEKGRPQLKVLFLLGI